MMAVEELVAELNADADNMSKWGDERGALILRTVVSKVRLALRTGGTTIVSPKEGADISGYSAAHLRRLSTNGALTNYGTASRPKFKIDDLPKKAKSKRADETGVAPFSTRDDNSFGLFRGIMDSKMRVR